MEEYSTRLNDLSGKDSLKFLKKVLAEFVQKNENDEFFLPAELIYYMLDDFEKPKSCKKKKPH